MQTVEWFGRQFARWEEAKERWALEEVCLCTLSHLQCKVLLCPVLPLYASTQFNFSRIVTGMVTVPICARICA